jgi:hypothetical protein
METHKVKIGMRLPGAILLSGTLITGAIYDVGDFQLSPFALLTFGGILFLSTIAIMAGD